MNCPLDIIADNLPSESQTTTHKLAAKIMAALAQNGFEITRADPQPERERIVQLLISADLASPNYVFHFPRRYLEHLADAIIKGRAN